MHNIDDIRKGKKEIGKVTPQERDEIKHLFERKNGLTELFKTLPDLEEDQRNILYEKIVADIGEVTTNFKSWWRQKGQKYNWEEMEGYKWEIDFESCEICLVKKK